MTISECRAACMALTFDLFTEDSPLFYPALNHAVADVSHFFPQYGKVTLHHTGMREAGIPYELTELTHDFAAFRETPLYGDLLYTVTGQSTLLLYADPGDYTLYYEKSLPLYGAGDDEKEILLPHICMQILPYFVASILLLDDDPEKATYYRSLYLSFLARYDTKRENIPTSFAVNTNGW